MLTEQTRIEVTISADPSYLDDAATIDDVKAYALAVKSALRAAYSDADINVDVSRDAVASTHVLAWDEDDNERGESDASQEILSQVTRIVSRLHPAS